MECYHTTYQQISFQYYLTVELATFVNIGNHIECLSSNGKVKHAKETAKRLDEQIKTVQREDKPQEQDFIALIVHKETRVRLSFVVCFLLILVFVWVF